MSYYPQAAIVGACAYQSARFESSKPLQKYEFPMFIAPHISTDATMSCAERAQRLRPRQPSWQSNIPPVGDF